MDIVTNIQGIKNYGDAFYLFFGQVAQNIVCQYIAKKRL